MEKRSTGYYDKDRKLIYEGNILERENHWDMKVVYDVYQNIFMGEIVHPDTEHRFRFPLDEIAGYSKIKEEI